MTKREALIRVCILIAALTLPSWANGNASFRIMTYNIRHGTPTDNEHINIAATAAAIAAESPDFICLQEVDKNCGRSGNVDQAAYLAEATGLGYNTFCKAIDFSDTTHSARRSISPTEESLASRYSPRRNRCR